MSSLVDPYEAIAPFDNLKNNPNDIYSIPKQQGMPENNRALEVTSRNDQQKEFSIGIKDIDEAVMWYFKNVLKLSVVQNNTRIEVPVEYANAESWKSMQRDGYYRDVSGKLLAPLIVFKRTSLTQNRGLGYKLDGNLAKNIQLFERGWSKRNYYSNFEALKRQGGRSPEKEYLVTAIPDYVTIEYSCTMWTLYIEQMDKLVEALNFASRGYWGDPNRFQFYSSIETFNEQIISAIGEDRAVKVDFGITLNGYLIPDGINKELASINRVFGVSKVTFGMETSLNGEDLVKKTK
jgi:hypothetical protein